MLPTNRPSRRQRPVARRAFLALLGVALLLAPALDVAALRQHADLEEVAPHQTRPAPRPRVLCPADAPVAAAEAVAGVVEGVAPGLPREIVPEDVVSDDRLDPAPQESPATRLDARRIVGFQRMPDVKLQGEYHGATVVHVDRTLRFVAVHVPADREASFNRAVSEDANALYCERDGTYRAQLTPIDPLWNDPGQYGMKHVKADLAWDTTLGTTAKTVCIVDTGVDYTHPDLAGPRWLGGYDFVNNDADPMDDHGHGTHVAGTAAATTNNPLGVAGAAQAGILGVKVLSASGSGQWSWVASGIAWCADNGGDVISLSLGGLGGSTAVENAVTYAYATKGKLVVAAAGNGGACFNCVIYPAKYDEAIAVTCTDQAKAQCGFSSDGPESELAAPGASILSTCAGGGYCYSSGTSMSTPHVSGVAALVWSHVPTLTNAQLRVILKCTAQDFGPGGWDQFYGHGIVDAKNALDRAIAGGCLGIPPPELPCGAVFQVTPGPVAGVHQGPVVVQVHHTLNDHVVGASWTWTTTGPPGTWGPPGLSVVPAGHDAWQVTGDYDWTYVITFAVSLSCGGPFLHTWTQFN